MCVCAYVNVCVCTCLCVYVLAHHYPRFTDLRQRQMRVYVCMCMCVHVFMYVRMCAWVSVWCVLSGGRRHKDHVQVLCIEGQAMWGLLHMHVCQRADVCVGQAIWGLLHMHVCQRADVCVGQAICELLSAHAYVSASRCLCGGAILMGPTVTVPRSFRAAAARPNSIRPLPAQRHLQRAIGIVKGQAK